MKLRVTLLTISAALFALMLSAWLIAEILYGRFTSPPRLVDGIGYEWGEDNSPLDQRLRALFPVGSSDEAVAQGLRAQGLELRGERHAQRAWGGLDCQYFVEVAWQADAEGRLTQIGGNYGKGC